jgi:hypothetical protein
MCLSRSLERSRVFFVCDAGGICFFCGGASAGWFAYSFAGIRVMTYPFTRRPCAGRHQRCGFAARTVWFACGCAGIRGLLLVCMRCPCAGRHLLFFAAAKKSRQKKAANTASACICLRAPTGSYASHGNHVTHVRCQRVCSAPHPPHAPALQHAVPAIPPPPRWQTVCRP